MSDQVPPGALSDAVLQQLLHDLIQSFFFDEELQQRIVLLPKLKTAAARRLRQKVAVIEDIRAAVLRNLYAGNRRRAFGLLAALGSDIESARHQLSALDFTVLFKGL